MKLISTTRISFFAERSTFCRGPWRRHSAKTALCRVPRQALGKAAFAEGREQALGNLALCRGCGARQRPALGKVVVRVTTHAAVPFAERLPFGSRQRLILCRVPAGQAPDMALGKDCRCRLKLCRAAFAEWALGKAFVECRLWLCRVLGRSAKARHPIVKEG